MPIRVGVGSAGGSVFGAIEDGGGVQMVAREEGSQDGAQNQEVIDWRKVVGEGNAVFIGLEAPEGGLGCAH
jgi:hypothetical protein